MEKAIEIDKLFYLENQRCWHRKISMRSRMKNQPKKFFVDYLKDFEEIWVEKPAEKKSFVN